MCFLNSVSASPASLHHVHKSCPYYGNTNAACTMVESWFNSQRRRVAGPLPRHVCNLYIYDRIHVAKYILQLIVRKNLFFEHFLKCAMCQKNTVSRDLHSHVYPKGTLFGPGTC